MSAGSQLVPEAVARLVAFYDIPVLVLDPAHTVALANRAAEDLTGSSDAALRGVDFAAALGLDAAAAAEILPPGWRPGKGPAEISREFVCRLRNGPAAPVVVRRVALGGSAVALLIESPRRWDRHYCDILSGSPVIVFEATADGRLGYGGDQLAESLGFTGGLPGSGFGDLVGPEQREFVDGIWRRVLAGEAVRGVELRMLNADGQTHSFWISFFPDDDTRGARGVRGIASDLSTQKSLAYALEAAEERFTVLFRESSDPILILSLAGEILSANPSFERITGVRSDELFCGEKQWSDFIYAEDEAGVRESLRRCAAQECHTLVEFRLKGLDGRLPWYEQTHSLLHDERGRPKGIMAVARDIDRHKRRERELENHAETMRQRHARVHQLIGQLKQFFEATARLPQPMEGFLDGVCDLLHEMYRPFLVFVQVASGRPELFRTGRNRPADIQGLAGRLGASILVKEMLASGTPLFCNALDQTPPYAAEPVVREWDLRTCLGAPLSDSTGRLWGAIAVLDRERRPFDSADVELVTIAALQIAARLKSDEQETSRRELEEHLRQAQKMEAVGMLAGGIAHDFNNLLSGILGFSSYLASKADPESTLRRDLKMIEQSATRAADLTRQLLAFARRRHFAKEPVPLNEVIQEVLGILEHSLAKNIVIQPELDERLPTVLGDHGQLNQVVMNLCINAAEAMAERGGTLRGRTESRSLTARERAMLPEAGDRPFICLTVADTGRGISREVQAHIFDPFFTTKANKGGSGLGLSIVYGIVTNHNGTITVESAEGQGAAFHVLFPAHFESAGAQTVAETVCLNGTETVLVVEDEPIVRQMATEILKDHGYQVVPAVSGDEAVEMFGPLKGRIDLVLLDLIMPGMDGEQTFQALRKMEPGLRILLTSGYAREDLARRLMEAGAAGLVHKPYKSEMLLAEIRRVLDGRAKPDH